MRRHTILAENSTLTGVNNSGDSFELPNPRRERLRNYYEQELLQLYSQFQKAVVETDVAKKLDALLNLREEIDEASTPTQAVLYSVTENACRQFIKMALLPKVEGALVAAEQELCQKFQQLENTSLVDRNIRFVFGELAKIPEVYKYFHTNTGLSLIFAYMSDVQKSIEKLVEKGIYDKHLERMAWRIVLLENVKLLQQMIGFTKATEHTCYVHNDEIFGTVLNTSNEPTTSEYKAFAWIIADITGHVLAKANETVTMTALKNIEASCLIQELTSSIEGGKFLKVKVGEFPESKET